MVLSQLQRNHSLQEFTSLFDFYQSVVGVQSFLGANCVMEYKFDLSIIV